ncbi:YihY/virulence factor BrkB family protein [Sulfitobacter sp. LCG007]
MLLVALGLQSMRKPRNAPIEVDTDAGRSRESRLTARPSEPASRDWVGVLKNTFSEISKDHVMLVAAGVTFYALLALFPALAAIVSIYGLFSDPVTIQEHLVALQGVVPEGGLGIIKSQLDALAAKGSSGLGIAFVIGLGTSLWSANAGVKSIFEALNIAYDETEDRSFVKLTLTAFAFTLAGIFVTLLTLGAVLVVPVVFSMLPMGQGLWEIVNWLRWPVMVVVVAVLIALLYRFGPSRPPPKWRWLTWGSSLAAVLWLFASALFSWYAANFGSYDATYGSLGAVIGFMTWIWISAIVVITGAELNAELERGADDGVPF